MFSLRFQITQILIVAIILIAVYLLGAQTVERLAALGIHTGFGFLNDRSGFRVGESLPLPNISAGFAIVAGAVVVLTMASYLALSRGPLRKINRRPLFAAAMLCCLVGAIAAFALFPIEFRLFTENDSLGKALIAGAINTLHVSFYALVFSTIIGVVVATMRISSNMLTSALGTGYVEMNRNLPLLLHLFFWYFAVVATLPAVNSSINILGSVYINQRGIFVPRILWNPGAELYLYIAGAAIVGAIFICLATRSRRVSLSRSARRFSWYALGSITLTALCATYLTLGHPFLIQYPVLQGFNFVSASVISPEFATLVVGLSAYHGAYSAEIIRGGILSVLPGQKEAGRALGMDERVIFRKIILPQAVRIIIPSMTNRYLNVIRGSSLGVAIGYQELVSVGHSVESLTGQVIEVTIIVMAFYILTSMILFATMNRLGLERAP